MDEDDDDLYEPGDSVLPTHTQNGTNQPAADVQPQDGEEVEEEEFEVEDDEVRCQNILLLYL